MSHFLFLSKWAIGSAKGGGACVAADRAHIFIQVIIKRVFIPMYFVIAYNFISQAKSGRSGILPAQSRRALSNSLLCGTGYCIWEQLNQTIMEWTILPRQSWDCKTLRLKPRTTSPAPRTPIIAIIDPVVGLQGTISFTYNHFHVFVNMWTRKTN